MIQIWEGLRKRADSNKDGQVNIYSNVYNLIIQLNNKIEKKKFFRSLLLLCLLRAIDN